MFKNVLALIIGLFIIFGIICPQEASCKEKVKRLRDIPFEWFTFQPKTLPFTPFSTVNYEEIYKTPVNTEQYANAGRKYNKNYKPYYPNKRIYATSDYSYTSFKRQSKKSDYNEWLWNTIRSDFKKTHGMYTATVTDFRGFRHEITWEDGGIISIYEQVKLFYEYARFNNNTRQKNYMFIHNFKYNYPDTRVNNPFLEFDTPCKQMNSGGFCSNQLFIKYCDKHHEKCFESTPYLPEYQNIANMDGVFEEKFISKNIPNIGEFIGPDAYLYIAENNNVKLKFGQKGATYEVLNFLKWVILAPFIIAGGIIVLYLSIFYGV